MKKLLLASAAIAVAATVVGCSSSPVSKYPELPIDAQTAKMYPGTDYPVVGRMEGTTGFISEADCPKKSNKKYPAWFRGNGKNGLADKDALYWYTEMIGPSAYKITKQMYAENMYCGTLALAPGQVYPAHNHPASEFYFIYEGVAEWYINDEKKVLKPGDMAYHRPFQAHGWKNIGKKEMKAWYCWWKEEGDKVNVMNYSASWINPEKFVGPKETVPYPIPLPPVVKAK